MCLPCCSIVSWQSANLHGARTASANAGCGDLNYMEELLPEQVQHLCLRSQASSSSRSFCRLMACISSWSLTMAGLERSFCQVALVFLESTKYAQG